MSRPVLPLLAVLLAALLALFACGQTGPLYLPDEPADSTQNAKKRSP